MVSWSEAQTDAKPHLRAIINLGMSLIVELIDDNDILAISAGHEQGELFAATADMIDAAVDRVEHSETTQELDSLAQSAEQIRTQIDELKVALEAGRTDETAQNRIIDNVRAITGNLRNHIQMED